MGKIVELNVDDNLITNDGFINLSDAKVATISGCDGYSFQNQIQEKDIRNLKRVEKNIFT